MRELRRNPRARVQCNRSRRSSKPKPPSWFKREREHQTVPKDRSQDRETHEQMVKERRRKIEDMRAELQETRDAAERKDLGMSIVFIYEEFRSDLS